MPWLEDLSYIVTILGFPIAIFVFVYEERRRLANDENELHRNLSEEYDNYLRLVLDKAVSDVRAGVFLIASRIKLETPEETQFAEHLTRLKCIDDKFLLFTDFGYLYSTGYNHINLIPKTAFFKNNLTVLIILFC